ncbi:MAG: threonine/serine exporter family protein, partial [Rikenellaceae bacterium]
MIETSRLNDQDVFLLRRKLDLLLRTGKLLMESAADTNRIERNMKRVAAYMGIPEDKLHLDIRWTMIVVNVSDEHHSFSKFQKCEKHGINMTTVSLISKLSWHAIEQDYSLDKYEEELEKIVAKPRNYTHYVVAIGAGFACGGFCKLFGGDWIAFLFASICAFIGFRIRARCIDFGINVYMSIAIAAFISTCLAYASSYLGVSATPYHPLLACALFIVPGVPLINFVDDMIDSHLMMGITRAANTAMMVGAMTFGIAFCMRMLVMEDIEIDHKFSELSMVSHDSYFIYAVAAAISAMGFSMIFNIQRKLLWVVAVGGIIAVCTRNFVNFELGFGPIIGSFMGGFVVSLIAVKAVHWFHVPNHVLTIPSVIPMIPGVLMYRSLLAFINLHGVVGEVTNAFYNGINSALIILCISLGVAVPNIFARRYIARDRQLFLQEELAARRSRGK